MRSSATTALAVFILATSAHAQTPQGLPVIFESDDARDGLYEAATDALAQLHFSEGVPLAQLTVPCGPGSTLSPYSCVTNTFHQRYQDWIAQHPGLIEIGLHGLFHTEYFGTLTRDQQLDMINKGLQQMATWGLPQGRPFAFAPPFSSENTDTISVLEQLGFHTSIRNSDTCLASTTMDTFCESVSLCQRDANGNRVAGPSCVLLSPATLISQVNARQGDGKAFLVYHVQDMVLSDLTTVDQNKMNSMSAILQAFRNEEAAGHYRLMTYDTYFQTFGGAPPTPTPGGDLTVYQDALATPWIDASWSATVDYSNTSPVFGGTHSIKVVATGWGALSVHDGAWGSTQELDPSRYPSLEFEVNGGSTGFNLAVRLENDAHFSFPAVVVGAIPANQWASVSVSMSQLNPTGQPFDRLDIFDANGTNRTYFVDDIRFAGSGSGGTPTPTLSPTSAPTATRPPVTPTPTPRPTTAPTASPTSTALPPTPTRTPTAAGTPPPPSPTPTPALTPAADVWVYRDARVAPWIDSSWSATIDYNNSSPVFAGTRSVKVVETGWGALSVHSGNWAATQPLNPAAYQGVAFQVYSTTAGFNPYVRLENDAANAFPAVVFGTIPVNQWTSVFVPMSQLDPAARPFDRLDIGDNNGANRTYFVDELRLVGK